jgi:hypothetical protein
MEVEVIVKQAKNKDQPGKRTEVVFVRRIKIILW